MNQLEAKIRYERLIKLLDQHENNSKNQRLNKEIINLQNDLYDYYTQNDFCHHCSKQDNDLYFTLDHVLSMKFINSDEYKPALGFYAKYEWCCQPKTYKYYPVGYFVDKKLNTTEDLNYIIKVSCKSPAPDTGLKTAISISE